MKKSQHLNKDVLKMNEKNLFRNDEFI